MTSATSAASPKAPIGVAGPSALRLTLPEPPSANRWWRKWRGRMVLSEEARAYQAMVLATVVQLRGRAWRRDMVFAPNAVSVSVAWYRKRRAGDLDKRLGILLDALQGIAYETDGQIIELVARRFDDPRKPRIEVTVTPTEEASCRKT